jgi:hypothetical protein
MEEHHWGGQGWNPAVGPEEEDLYIKTGSVGICIIMSIA